MAQGTPYRPLDELPLSSLTAVRGRRVRGQAVGSTGVEDAAVLVKRPARNRGQGDSACAAAVHGRARERNDRGGGRLARLLRVAARGRNRAHPPGRRGNELSRMMHRSAEREAHRIVCLPVSGCAWVSTCPDYAAENHSSAAGSPPRGLARRSTGPTACGPSRAAAEGLRPPCRGSSRGTAGRTPGSRGRLPAPSCATNYSPPRGNDVVGGMRGVEASDLPALHAFVRVRVSNAEG
jgi:hypothetical protein